jgi:TldD protein
MQSPSLQDISSDLSLEEATRLVKETLHGADDGELFIEKRQTESLSFDDGKLKSSSIDDTQGFGLRAVTGETAAYAHATELSSSALKRATSTARAVLGSGKPAHIGEAPQRTNSKLYGDHNPSEGFGFSDRVNMLEAVNAYARGLDSKVRQVSASISTDYQDVTIIRPDGEVYRDVRPLFRFNVGITTDNGKIQGQGGDGFGGRGIVQELLTENAWKAAAEYNEHSTKIAKAITSLSA